MKLFTLLFIMFVMVTNIKLSAQEEENSGKSEPTIEELKGQVEGIDENVTTLLNDVSALKKIKVSGYMQIQFEKSEAAKGFSMSPYDSSNYIQSRFRVRKSRLIVTYDAGMTQYVLQGDFSNEKFELKDAYISFSEPWLKYFTLTTGVFNRPNYEIEYSSSMRESAERSRVIRTLYPGERDLGIMLTMVPDYLFKLQIAAFNNTFLGDLRQFFPNFNNEPLYYMFRLTKEFSFQDLGLGLDLGVNARMGNVLANTNKVFLSESPTLDTNKINTTKYKKGDKLSRSWFGVEAQVYFDLLGGMKLIGEYMTGSDVDELTTADKSASPIRLRDFSGFYVMFVNNLTEEFQVVVKYDSYNPNTKISKTDIDATKDLPVSTLGLGLLNYTFENIRIMLWYDMNMTTTSDNLVKGKKLLEKDPIDNQLTLRFQYKF